MRQEVTQHIPNAPHRHDGSKAVGAWHPAGREDITPLKAQVLYACTEDNFSSTHIPFLGAALGASVETIESSLQSLIDNQLLLRCIMPPCDTFMPTNSGYAILNRIASRKPEILTMTKDLLNLTLKGRFS